MCVWISPALSAIKKCFVCIVLPRDIRVTSLHNLDMLSKVTRVLKVTQESLSVV